MDESRLRKAGDAGVGRAVGAVAAVGRSSRSLWSGSRVLVPAGGWRPVRTCAMCGALQGAPCTRAQEKALAADRQRTRSGCGVIDLPGSAASIHVKVKHGDVSCRVAVHVMKILFRHPYGQIKGWVLRHPGSANSVINGRAKHSVATKSHKRIIAHADLAMGKHRGQR